MAVPRRAANKQRFNLRKETTYGVAPPVIDTRLNGLRITPTKDGSTDMFMPSGSSLPTLGTRFDDFTTLDVSGRLTFQDPLWLWGSILGEPVTTQPGTLAYQHIFRWNGFDIVQPVSYGLVYGDENSAVQVAGALFNSLGFTAGRGAVTEITAGGFGKKQQTGAVIYPRQSSFTLTITATGGTYTITWNGQVTSALAFGANAATILAALDALSNVVAATDITLTGTGPYTIAATKTGAFGGTDVTATVGVGSLTGGSATLVETQAGGPVTSIPATPISPLIFDVWADGADTGATWASLGTTQLLGCLEFEMGMGDRHVRVQPMKSDQSADGIAEGESQDHSVRMKLLYDGVAESMFGRLDRGDLLYTRLQAQGAANQIETGHTFLYRQDQAVLIESVGVPESFGGGVMAIDIAGKLATDTTASKAIEVTMKNNVSAIL